jgi:putative FmdB family regulatory protein
MPIYDFECKDCGDKFEALVTVSAPVICPRCGGDKAAKTVSTHSVYYIKGDNSASTRPKGG